MIPFAKLQGAGNDFIILDNRDASFSLEYLQTLSRVLCCHAKSLGADGLIAVEKSSCGADLKMAFFNADGSVGEMCGNGVRSLARYAFEKGLAGQSMTLETMSGVVHAWRLSKRRYKTRLNPATRIEMGLLLTVGDQTYPCSYVELGNPGLPHAVVPQSGLLDNESEKLAELGAAIRHHGTFPKGANVNFYEIIGDQRVRIKTYERGVEGFTLACGTGSASLVLVLVKSGLLKKETVEVVSEGGSLWVDLGETDACPPYLSGDTNYVAEGVILDEDLPLPILERRKI